MLTLIGGIFVLLAGIAIAIVGAAFTFFMFGIGAIFGVFGIVWGIIIIFSAYNLRSNPSHHITWGTIILVFAFISWWGSIGGFFIGFLLTLIGGILALVWAPPRGSGEYVSVYGPPPPQPAPSATGTRYCPNCGRSIALDAKYCSYCGKELG
jgi:hypothetical protein